MNATDTNSTSSTSSDGDEILELIDLLSDLDDEDLEQFKYTQDVSVPKIKRINHMHRLNDGEFTFRFRLNKSTVQLLLFEIMPYIKVTSRRNHGVAPLHQLLLTLRFYAVGTVLASVADFVGVSRSSASRIVQNVSSAMAMLYSKYILMHQNSKVKFYKIAQFPRVLGVIDCTHVRINSPSRIISEEFRNSMRYFSLNVQAVCDADLKLMNVIAYWPGSASNASIFSNSVLKEQCESGHFGNCWLIGDDAYPCKSYFLTPVSDASTSSELMYNEAHLKTRNCITQTIELWKKRFPVIGSTLRLSLENIQTVIIATAVLHNVSRDYHVPEVNPEVEMQESERIISHTPPTDEIDTLQREQLISNFFSE